MCPPLLTCALLCWLVAAPAAARGANSSHAFFVLRTPSCEVAPGFRTDCAHTSTCACYRECEALDGFLGLPGESLICFNHTAVPGAPPHTLEDVLAAPAMTFGRAHVLPPGGTSVPEVASADAWQPRKLTINEAVLHPSACPGRRNCSWHGWCKADEPRCQCFAGWHGEACDVPAPEALCLNACSARGACRHGVCSCHAGSHGVDCSLPLATDAADTSMRPRIYIYELPAAFNVWREMVAINRNPTYLLWERLLASPYRTARGADADFFFVPVAAMGGVSHGTPLLAAEYIKAHWPFWNAPGGPGRHLFVWPWDFGPCWVAKYADMVHAVHISHYGLSQVPPNHDHCSCSMCGPAYVPGKDIVIPSTLEFDTILKSPFAHARGAKAPPPPPRDVLLFFSGGATGPERTRILAVDVKAHADVKITSGGVDLAEYMSRSVFCIGSPGAGYGTRAVLAVLMGCIPVLVGDNVAQAFEAQVDWSAFSVRVPEAQLGRIVDIVRALPPADVASMQAALACVWPFFSWSGIWGALAGEDGSSDAFEVLMYTLRERALYGAQRRKLGCEPVPGGWVPKAPLCRAGECPDGLAPQWPHGGAVAVAMAAAAAAG
jgi:hypothetical protein